MSEKWKVIPSIPEYAVSSIGRVKSLERRLRFLSKKGKECWRVKKETILSQQKQNGGYMIVHLHVDSIRRAKTVHSLVAESFIGPRPKGLDVCHRDGKRINNGYKNLKYRTRSVNFKDMHAHGTYYKRVTASKLKASDVRRIRKIKGVESASEIATRYGVQPKQIHRIWSGINWSHVK